MIVLFDLDGTVLTYPSDGRPGPGRTSMGRASTELFGRDHTVGVRFAGGTDRAIARALLDRAGLPFEEPRVEALVECYLAHLAVVLVDRPYVPVGDVAGAVLACRARGAIVGVATGNVRRGAAIKLRSAGLAGVFDLELGGYGCDHELRGAMVAKAVERCGGVGPVVVIGDTRHDVEAARAVAGKVVGVALDASARAELEAAGADAVVDACGTALVDAIFAVA